MPRYDVTLVTEERFRFEVEADDEDTARALAREHFDHLDGSGRDTCWTQGREVSLDLYEKDDA